VDVPEGLRAALQLGLADAVRARRSRRFGLGMSMPEGPLAHTSAHAPVPLTELEQAFLVWAGTGATGLALGDLPRDGLSWMHGWDGRSWPCSLNSHSTHLFLSDDEGLWLIRPGEAEPPPPDAPLEVRAEAALAAFRRDRVQLETGRPDLPTGEPGLFSFNAWNANRPGTSLFVPVTDMTLEYLALLFIYFDEDHRFTVVDEVAGGEPCGLEPWLRTGRIRRDVTLSLVDLEMRVLTSLNVEGAFMCQTMALALQALGLGGWTFTGFLPHHLLGGGPDHRGLGFRFVRPAQSPRHAPAPAPVGRDGVLEGLCPPYVRDMGEAVERFLADRALADAGRHPYRRPDEVVPGRGVHDPVTREIVTAFCTRVLERHGRFPAFVDPMFVRLVLQAHHLDLDFYDRHYRPGAYTPLHREHMRLWHPELA
jgi:hypothetical protein